MGDKRIEPTTVDGKRYLVEIEAQPDDSGYVATVRGLPGCVTQGETLKEVCDMAKDAIRCWLEAREDLKRRGVLIPRN